MLSIEDIKKIDPELAKMSDSELESMLADMYASAQLGVELYMLEKSGSKNPVGSLPDIEGNAKL